jgi:Pentapeptide repeats (8 copies)
MPEEEQRRSPPAWWLSVWERRWWIALVALFVALFILVWLLVPPLLYRHSGTDNEAKLKAITDTRTALLAGLIGVGALLTFWLNSRVYRITAQTLQVTEQGQITERYTKAIEQLGSDKLDVRLGGIYALERIAVDSKRDHPTVVEVLSAFVREHSRRHGTPPPKQGMAEEVAEKPDATATDATPRPATDVQAALSVLGRLPQQPDVSRGDLSGAQLAGAQLLGANLSGAGLYGANLSGAELSEADLSDAELSEADLSDAELTKADLSGAGLHVVNLSGAWLPGANLSDAELTGADLSGAGLYGANLRQAQGLTQPQLDGAQGDAETQLPAGLERPASWTAPATDSASPQ